jgi:hypothetical protein
MKLKVMIKVISAAKHQEVVYPRGCKAPLILKIGTRLRAAVKVHVPADFIPRERTKSRDYTGRLRWELKPGLWLR